MSLPPVECIYLTEDSIKELKNANSNFKFPSPAPVLRFLYELCWTVVRGDLPFQKCKVALEAVEFADCGPDGDVGSNFADVVTQMAQDLTMLGEHRSRLIKLAKWLVESALVPVRFFQERCEEEFLWESEMTQIKAADLKSKEVRVNTRLLYQQTKFNLLREESEGYAKLVTLLCRVPEACTKSASAATVGIIKSLIGHFDLDPNRVFDIVLECFELQPDNNVFLDLIPMFPKSHASQILGFKFQYHQRMEVTTPVPIGLYELAALLVKKDFIDVDSIYAHLLPKDEEAFEHYNSFSAKRLDEANKIGKINLAATGKDLMDDEKQGDVTVDLFAALDMENGAVAERSSELENNQTLGLLIGFLAVDDWCHARQLLDRLSKLNPVEHIQICNGLFRLIEKSISPACELVRQNQFSNIDVLPGSGTDLMETGNSSHSRSFINLPKELFEMLASAGPYLYRDTLLLQKASKVLRAYYLCALELVNNGYVAFSSHTFANGNENPRLHLKDARLRIEEALGTCLLPSLQLIPANPAVGQEIWELMSLLPYEVRYRLYGEWEKDDDRFPMILAARQTAKLDTRRILKRLAKENLKQLGRMVAKLAHANPMTVLRTIVHQIEAYRDMITPVVDAFKYLTQLEYDILEYVVIERLAQGGREKLKDDGLNLSDWLQSLASFWGHLCKKYPSMELRGLFQYLVNQLKKGYGIELVLLQELIQQMANVQYTENMTEDQLDAMAGSDTLRYQATSFGITRNNKALIKSTNRLRDSLLPKEEPKLAIPLLLLIAQHRSLVVIKADVPHIKMVSEQFDRCHGTLLQYVEFLCSAVTPVSNYALLIPTLDELVHQYLLDPEVAFLIYRPVMRLFRCQKASCAFWPLDGNEELHPTTSEKDSETADASTLILDLGSSRKPIFWLDLLDTIKTMLPSKAWNSLSPDLYATFWGLTLYDLYVPRTRYESEIAKQHSALKALEELSDNSSSAIAKRKKDKERIQESLDRLTMELQKHEEHVESVRRRLTLEKDTWLSSCPDTLKINMEFLQRCVFPRCTFSMPDAVYCAIFVNTLHSLGTPFFNTVNHIDVLICKTLQPMICCCTEYEVGRLGRFLYETLKTAYHWKSDESVYERECGNMPGFAVYYRYPNSQRVTYGQFIKVHWKWSQRITRLLIQCLESTEYMEIRNALIMLTKISGVFPVTRKSGINLEKRVAKIKSDEREDLKVLATGVAAALAARKPSWVTDEEFGMGYLEIKPAPAPASASKSLSVTAAAVQNVPGTNVSPAEPVGSRAVAPGTLHSDSGSSVKDLRMRSDGRIERTESNLLKSDPSHLKLKGGSVNGVDVQSSVPSTLQSGISRSVENLKQMDESANKQLEENSKVTAKMSMESEARSAVKRSTAVGSLAKQPKQDLAKDDGKSGKAVGRTSVSSSGNPSTVSASAKGTTLSARSSDHNIEAKAEIANSKSSDSRVSTGKDDGTETSDVHKQSSSRSIHSPGQDNLVAKSSDKPQKRTSPADELDRLNKRRKGEIDLRDMDGGEVRFSEKERLIDARGTDKLHPADFDKPGSDELNISRVTDKLADRSKDKTNERYDRDYRERLERPEKSRGDDILSEKLRDRSLERHGRERSVERVQEKGADRNFDRLGKDDRNKDDRSKVRHNEAPLEKSHVVDRFHGQSLPPPPPLLPHVIPQSVNASRREDDADRRFGTARHAQRLSPRHDERERRRSEENILLQDDAKRRREDDFRDRKRDERDMLSVKVEEKEKEKEREREKTNILKEEMDSNASKRRKLKREHPQSEPGEYLPAAPQSSPLSYDGRERGDRKGVMVQRPGYMEEPALRIHAKEAATKTTRRDADPMYDREWDDEKRQRAEPKRRHRK
ncbi:THO complex subunit 2 [Olea europaea subsp. europaea]|uniref:THO complex subunit 2 n=1 Tax=Olea europaea subsp. europaea TaxID=158383 RepID=A0A8S0Q849_OLEEU|nr:THO complex subunit 2 [Olea europaea subsp. europaea]